MLTIALPSKGRLKEQTESYFEKIGLPIATEGGSREYVGKFEELQNHQILFLQASEISKKLADGSIDCGVTGLDLICERQAEDEIFTLKELGFGKANLVMAIPETWIDVHSMSDLDDIMFFFRKKHGIRFRIATKYIHLTTQFLKKRGMMNYRIIESQGATEGAPAASLAEAIIDITSTGKTLESNALKIISDGTILESQALFAASCKSEWDNSKLIVLKRILDFIAAYHRARSYKILHGSFAPGAKKEVIDCMISFKAKDMNISDTGFVCLMNQHRLHAFTEVLRDTGINIITVSDCNTVFCAESEIYDQFIKATQHEKV